MIGYFMLQKQSSVDELKNAVQAINDAKTKLSKKVQNILKVTWAGHFFDVAQKQRQLHFN